MSQRRHARALAAITVVDIDDPAAPSYTARDISVGGLFLLLEGEKWPVGITRRIAIEHEGKRIEADARVVRTDDTGVALQLTDPPEELKTRIRGLLVDLVYEGVPLGEHRRAHRFETTSPVLWALGSGQYRSTLSDLSPTGACIRAERPPELDAEIYVQLPIVELRAGVPVVEEVHGSKAVVVRHIDGGFAVHFKNASDGFRRCRDPEAVRAMLRQRDAELHGTDHQIDTYFACDSGRLKLRRGNIETALIHYQREDTAGPKESHVTLYHPADAAALEALLRAALEVLVVVDKQRDIWFAGNVKMHVDEVEGLGSFVEIEAIDVDGTHTQSSLLAQCQQWLAHLGVRDEDLVTCSYSDLV